MKKLYLIIAISILFSNPAYSQIRVGGIGDSITLGSGYRLVLSNGAILGAVGSYRFLLQQLLAQSGIEVDMVGIWGREDGDAVFIGEEAINNDQNHRVQDFYDTDHTGWSSIKTKELVDFFISANGSGRLYPKPNPIKSTMIIHIGTNDRSNPINETIGHVKRLIDYMTEYDSTIKLIICQIIPTLNVETYTDNYNIALKNLVEGLNQDNLLLVDLNTPLKNRPELYYDSVHPNKDGYEFMANLLYFAMIKHLVTVTCGEEL